MPIEPLPTGPGLIGEVARNPRLRLVTAERIVIERAHEFRVAEEAVKRHHVVWSHRPEQQSGRRDDLGVHRVHGAAPGPSASPP